MGFVSMPPTTKKTFVESICYLADSLFSVRDSINSCAKGIEGAGKNIESAGKEIGKELHYIGDSLKESVQIGAAGIGLTILFGFATCQVNSNYVQRRELQEQKALYKNPKIGPQQSKLEHYKSIRAAYHTLDRRLWDLEK